MNEEKSEETLEEKVSEEQGQKSNRNRNLIIAGVGVVVLACLCVVVAAVVIFVTSPGLLGRLFGGFDPIASTLPADTAVYMQIDLLKLADEDLSNIINTFADAADDPDISNTDDMIEQLDEAMQDEWGMTFSDDVRPWIGQYAAVAFTDFTLDQYGEPDPNVVVFIVEVLNQDNADAFIANLRDVLENEQDYTFTEQEVDGDIIYVGESSFGDEMAIARVGKFLYVSPAADTIESVLSVASSDSLAKSDSFTSTLAGLPNDRMTTLYFNFDALRSAIDYMEEEFAFDPNSSGVPFDAYQGMGMSMTAASNRLQMDVSVMVDSVQLDEAQLDQMSVAPDAAQFLSNLPSDTYILLSGTPFSEAWAISRENLVDTLGDREFNNAMQDVEDTLGFNPDTDLFPILNGEWALAVYESNNNYLANNLDAPVGMMVMALSSDADSLTNFTDGVAAYLSDEPYLDVTESTSGDVSLYEVVDQDFNETLFSFGTGNDALLIGTDLDVLESVYSNADSLATNQRFLEYWNDVPNNSNPSIYVDVQALISVIVGSGSVFPDEVRPLDPIEAVIVSSTPYRNDLTTASLIVFLDIQQ